MSDVPRPEEVIRPGQLVALPVEDPPHPPSSGNLKMEMYGVLRAEIEALIRDARCQVAHISESTDSGPEWLAWQYVVVKP
jgi:hypothetical protein